MVVNCTERESIKKRDVRANFAGCFGVNNLGGRVAVERSSLSAARGETAEDGPSPPWQPGSFCEAI